MALAASVGELRADVKMPSIFGDHMVLQQESSLPVWGTADPGEKVKVSLGAAIGEATADAAGKWLLKLPPQPAGTPPLTMTVEGRNTLKFSDVLVGEVWVCSGQSNMEMELSLTKDAATAVPMADDPQLRLFRMKRTFALEPQATVEAKWVVCTPESAKNFSGVGYFFGRELRAKLNRPVGLIGTYLGSTGTQAWTSIEGLKRDPELQEYVDDYEKIRAEYPKAAADFPAQQAAYQDAVAKWQQETGNAYDAAMKQWADACKQAAAANQPPPRQPRPAVPKPTAPTPPDHGQWGPANLFNGMVAPLIPYAIKGVAWYQGESNAYTAFRYRIQFRCLIADWREKWGQGDFPFLFVQLANYRTKFDWATLRESQWKTLALPNTGMASAVDVGDPNQIHYADKLDVGLRLALVARHVAYGENIVSSGPLYEAMAVEDGAVRIQFTQRGGGLAIGAAPYTAPGVPPLPTDTLVGFTMAGDDRTFVPAEAKIDGDTVVVSSPKVPHPVAVRYGWDSCPQCNLYNKEGLPASPFRTDDWYIAPTPNTP